MKVLVDEISFEKFNEIKKYFITDDEIGFIEFCDSAKAFYVEEKIKDLDYLLKLCEDMNNNNKHELRRKLTLDDFCGFWWLLREIKKQREVGYKITDIEYVYLKVKDCDSIELLPINQLNYGYDLPENTKCIKGKTLSGEFILYKETEELHEFVFSFNYRRKTIFGKEVVKWNHFHPQNCIQAIDSINWIKDSENIIKKL